MFNLGNPRPLSALFTLWLLAGVTVLATPSQAAGDDGLWQAINTPGHVVIMRHALAPGTGDPANFKLGDCGTQRNLSDEGRDQARSIGLGFRQAGMDQARVFTSQWCRCRDTAALLDLGPVEEHPVLNSFFATPEDGPSQTEALRRWLAEQDLTTPLLLVTHQVNITALTGVFPASGEMVILKRETDGTLTLVGTLATR